MNYQKIYNDLIIKAQSENRKKKNGIYYENHHIIPKCLGGSDNKDNLVLLTAKEHYIAHALLYFIDKNPKLAYAWNLMSVGSKYNKRYNSRLFQIAKIENIKHLKENFSGEKNPYYNKKHTKEIRKKISEAVIKNYKINPKTEDLKLRAIKTFKGKPKSEKQKLKMSKVAKNRLSLINRITQKTITIKNWERNLYSKVVWISFYKNSRLNPNNFIEIICPHCNKKSDKGNSSFLAWHFDNCKNKLGYQKKRKSGGKSKECWSPWNSPKNYKNDLENLYKLLPEIENFLLSNKFSSGKDETLKLKKHIPDINNFKNHQIRLATQAIKNNKFNDLSKQSWNNYYKGKIYANKIN